MSKMRDQPFPGSGGAYRVANGALVPESSKPKAAPVAKASDAKASAPIAAKTTTPNATAARRDTNQE